MLWKSGYLDSTRDEADVEWLHALTRGTLSLETGAWLLLRFKVSEDSQPHLARVKTLLNVEGTFYLHVLIFEGALQKASYGSLWAMQDDLNEPTCETCCPLQDVALTTLRTQEMKKAGQEWHVFREARCLFNMRSSTVVYNE